MKMSMTFPKVGVPSAVALSLAACIVTGPAGAQVVTGELGSPSATITVPPTQLPAQPQKFGGVIKETLVGSKTWWPPRVVPPKGAPNVLLIMTTRATA